MGASATSTTSSGQNHETEQVSLEEFLESCRATSLLAELEDDEELPEAEEEDNDDDANDEEDYDENFDEESATSEPRNTTSTLTSRRKTWDEEHVIKRKFSALIPAFDPRPGRTNVNQTSDLDITLPSNNEATREASPSTERPTPERDVPRLQLSLRGPNIPGVTDVEMDLRNPDWSIFKAVQQCIQSSSIGSKADKIRRVWEPTYVIVYRECKEKSPSGEISISILIFSNSFPTQ